MQVSYDPDTPGFPNYQTSQGQELEPHFSVLDWSTFQAPDNGTAATTVQTSQFACPFLQYNLHHQTARFPRCGAVGSSQMAEVRRHVKRKPHSIPLVWCRACKTHFPSEAQFRAHAPIGCDKKVTLSQEDQWFSIYRSLTGSWERPRGACKYFSCNSTKAFHSLAFAKTVDSTQMQWKIIFS